LPPRNNTADRGVDVARPIHDEIKQSIRGLLAELLPSAA